jgi:hypothetical protein
MYVPVNPTNAARAAIVLGAAGPWGLIELGLVELPDAAWTGKESERHRTADRQQVGRPDDRHAGGPARRAVVARAGAAEARGGEAAIGPSLEVDQPPRAVSTSGSRRAAPGRADQRHLSSGLEARRAWCEPYRRSLSRVLMSAVTASCGMRAHSSAFSSAGRSAQACGYAPHRHERSPPRISNYM